MAARQPRIALVVPTFPKLSETFIVRHVLGLDDRGWDVHVLCRRFDRAAFDGHSQLSQRAHLKRRIHLEPRLRPRLRVPIEGTRAALGWLRRPSTFRRVAASGPSRLLLDSALARLRPDLVHFEFGSLATERIHAVRALGARSVVSFRGFDLNFVGLDRANHYRSVWQHADALHLLGRDLWRRALTRGCPPDKARALIPPAVDAECFSPKDRQPERREGPLRLLSIGRLEWKKGHEYALRALRQLLDQGIEARLTIVGDGVMLGALGFSRHHFDLADHVTLAGALGPDQVREQLAKADVFVHLAVSEGFCNAVLEAQAMGLPVVASDADGLAENVEPGVTGFIVPRRDPSAASGAIRQLAEDPERRLEMGRAGRQRALREFPPEREIEAFESLYRDVLSGRSLEGELTA